MASCGMGVLCWGGNLELRVGIDGLDWMDWMNWVYWID